MSPLTDLERIRSDKADRLRQAGMDPYPPRSKRTHTTAEAVRLFETAPAEAAGEVTVAGRLRSIRRMGKAVFAHVEDAAGQLQLFLRTDELGPERLEIFNDLFDLGDFVQAAGSLFRTRAGEITLRVAAFTMLAKAIAPLPSPKAEVVDGQRVVHSPFADPESLLGKLFPRGGLPQTVH